MAERTKAPHSKCGIPLCGIVSSNLTPIATKTMLKFFKKNKKEPKSISEVFEYLKKIEEDYANISREIEDFKKESRRNLQKVGMVRFNPFAEVGGDQSFSIALLDANNNGFVITSHYHRDTSRTYAKPIEQGQSKYQLSKEEQEAITRATGSK